MLVKLANRPTSNFSRSLPQYHSEKKTWKYRWLGYSGRCTPTKSISLCLSRVEEPDHDVHVPDLATCKMQGIRGTCTPLSTVCTGRKERLDRKSIPLSLCCAGVSHCSVNQPGGGQDYFEMAIVANLAIIHYKGPDLALSLEHSRL